MPKYQIQFKNNSKTFTDTLEANSHVEIIDLFKSLINAELTEIREVVYTNNTYPIDDGDYIKGKKIYMTNNKGFSRTVKVPKVKKTIEDEKIEELAFLYLKMNDKSINKLTIFNL